MVFFRLKAKAIGFPSLTISLSLSATDQMDSSKPLEISTEVFPYIRVYSDGTNERLAGTEVTPAGLDPETNVLSKDIVVIPETGVSARLYRPGNLTETNKKKLPLVVYFHGGAFIIASSADPKYHTSMNKLVAEADVILVSVNYRLAPEHPLPAAFDDSWAALRWVASHVKGDCTTEGEPWLKDYVDFDRVFLFGDSAGASISHHLATRIKSSDPKKPGLEIDIRGLGLINPYFWGKDPIGAETTDEFRKQMVDQWWMFVCPSDKGCDDPLINPFADGAPDITSLGCEKVLVTVAEKDILRDRGWLYYTKLGKSGWTGKVEMMETEGEDHVFHIFAPDSEKAKILIKSLADFITKAKDGCFW